MTDQGSVQGVNFRGFHGPTELERQVGVRLTRGRLRKSGA